jgi:hypothetical protein
MATITVTTCIRRESYDECKTNHWKWSELIYEGIIHKKETPAILARLREVESDRLKLRDKLVQYATELEQVKKEIAASKNQGNEE